jgi:hypothetical protein
MPRRSRPASFCFFLYPAIRFVSSSSKMIDKEHDLNRHMTHGQVNSPSYKVFKGWPSGEQIRRFCISRTIQRSHRETRTKGRSYTKLKKRGSPGADPLARCLMGPCCCNEKVKALPLCWDGPASCCAAESSEWVEKGR